MTVQFGHPLRPMTGRLAHRQPSQRSTHGLGCGGGCETRPVPLLKSRLDEGTLRGVIVVIDANSLMADPMCSGAVWQVMAHAPSSWALRVVTTGAVVVEVVAGYRRELTQAVAALEKTSRGWGRLGAQAAANAAREQLLAKADAYAEALASALSDAGVESWLWLRSRIRKSSSARRRGADLAMTRATATGTRCFGSASLRWRPPRKSQSRL